MTSPRSRLATGFLRPISRRFASRRSRPCTKPRLGTSSRIVAPKRRGRPTKPAPGDVAKKPGQCVEQIGKARGQKTRELALPIIRVIDGKKLATKGKRRRTRYVAR
jgi:hypothetical protein